MSGPEPMNATARGTAPVDRGTVAGRVGLFLPADIGHRARWLSKAAKVELPQGIMSRVIRAARTKIPTTTKAHKRTPPVQA